MEDRTKVKVEPTTANSVSQLVSEDSTVTNIVSKGPYGDYGRRISMSFYKQRITIGRP
jgi:hypothetical protein